MIPTILDRLSSVALLVGSCARRECTPESHPKDIDLIWPIDRRDELLGLLNGFDADPHKTKVIVRTDPIIEVFLRADIDPPTGTTTVFGVPMKSTRRRKHDGQMATVMWRGSNGKRYQQRLRCFDEPRVEIVGKPGLVESGEAVPRAGDIFRNLVAERYKVSRGCGACDKEVMRMNSMSADECRAAKAEILAGIWERRSKLKGWKGLAAKLPGAKLVALAELGALFDQAIAEVTSSQRQCTD